jgi:Ca2+-binding RTX toxin-like protein
MVEGGGSDRLTGGSGGDIFDFVFVENNSLFGGQDIVTDFSRAQGDQIGSGVFFTSGRVIGNPFDQFDTNDNGRIDDADGSSRVQDVRFDSSVGGGSTVLTIEDVEGVGGDVQLTLTGVTDLRESDFLS